MQVRTAATQMCDSYNTGANAIANGSVEVGDSRTDVHRVDAPAASRHAKIGTAALSKSDVLQRLARALQDMDKHSVASAS